MLHSRLLTSSAHLPSPRASRKCGRAAAALTGALLTLTAASTHSAPSMTPDANALVRQVVATYQASQTIQEKSVAKIRLNKNADFIQQSEISFRRPNLLTLKSVDPSTGTLNSFCDGKTVTVYSGRTNVYTKRNAPASLQRTLDVVSKASAEILGANLTQIFSPLSLLCAKGMPNEAKEYTYVGTGKVDGRSVVIVSGEADSAWLAALLPIKEAVMDKRKVTLWIEPNTKTLLRSACDFAYHVNVAARSNTPAMKASGIVQIEETHRDIVLNAPIREETFSLFAPKGAAEKYQERR